MKNMYVLLIACSLFVSCSQNESQKQKADVNWNERELNSTIPDSIFKGSSYLPIYSQIYQLHAQKTYDLTVTVSLRNISLADTVFISKADYFNTAGELIHQYLHKPIYIKPLETLEIVIEESDQSGGTGANFIFDWATKNENNEPLFEAVMISTTGQQGISFLSRGKKITK